MLIGLVISFLMFCVRAKDSMSWKYEKVIEDNFYALIGTVSGIFVLLTCCTVYMARKGFCCCNCGKKIEEAMLKVENGKGEIKSNLMTEKVLLP